MPEAIAALLEFLPFFEYPPQPLYTPDQNSPFDPFTYTPEVRQFEATLYQTEFIIVGFDWGSWKTEARRYIDDPALVAHADLDTLRKLLTLHVRQERFLAGHLAAMLDNGHVLAILRRLADFR